MKKPRASIDDARLREYAIMNDDNEGHCLPLSLVPTPTREYNQSSARNSAARQMRRAIGMTGGNEAGLVEASGPILLPRLPNPIPLPFDFTSRMLIYKQDPTVTELGIRKVLVRGLIQSGPRNSRIHIDGVAPVAPNSMNDYIQAPNSEGFDTVHTFAVVNSAVTLCQRAVGTTIKWQSYH